MTSLVIATALQVFYFNHTPLPFHLSLINNPISSLTRVQTIINDNPYLFNHEIVNPLPITDQKSSGRCWLFASLNLVRVNTFKNWQPDYEINDLEFSQTYNYFWDKFERYHRSLRYFIKINKLPESTKLMYLLKLYADPLGDGGQWDMAREIIKKYGIVPKSVMPDSYHSKASSGMNRILTAQLKQDFISLNKINEMYHEYLINSMMDTVYKLLIGFLGNPPIVFDYVFKNKNQIISWDHLTPLELLKRTYFNPDEWISIIHDPRNENPYYRYYQIEYLGNVADQHVGWINLPMSRLKQLTKESIDSNQPVWFGCDVGAHFDKETGIHDINIFDLKTFMNHEITLTKEERLNTFLSLPTHAMLIVGYHETDGIIKRWKIENSWGNTAGTNGFQLMTDEWFDEYVFQIVVHKSKLFDNEKQLLETVPVVIPPWDPLGTLAF
jgi:bleomycin hydrolase